LASLEGESQDNAEADSYPPEKAALFYSSFFLSAFFFSSSFFLSAAFFSSSFLISRAFLSSSLFFCSAAS